MVYLSLDDPGALVAAAAEQGVRFSAVGSGRVRLVTHLDFDDADLAQTIAVLARLAPA